MKFDIVDAGVVSCQKLASSSERIAERFNESSVTYVYYLCEIHQVYIRMCFYLRLLVDAMLSFEVSVVDIVLAAVLVVLLGLQVAKKPHPAKSEVKSHVEEVPQPLQESQKVDSKASKLKDTVSNHQTSYPKCEHSFGYLRSLPKNTSVPDECLGCMKIMKCLFKDE